MMPPTDSYSSKALKTVYKPVMSKSLVNINDISVSSTYHDYQDFSSFMKNRATEDKNP